MRATHVLADQHQAIAALFGAAMRGAQPRARRRAVSRLAEELIAHMAGEEGVFYPALLRTFGRDEGDVCRAREEHHRLKVELRRVLARDAGDPAFEDGILALQRIFEQHVVEEETRIFPRVERALEEADNEVLGAEILASRPPIWMVATERSLAAQRTVNPGKLRSRVSLPIPPARG